MYDSWSHYSVFNICICICIQYCINYVLVIAITVTCKHVHYTDVLGDQTTDCLNKLGFDQTKCPSNNYMI